MQLCPTDTRPNLLYPPLNPACPGARAHCLPFRLTDEQSTSLMLDQHSLAWLWKLRHIQTLTNDAITLKQLVEAELLHKLQPAQHKCNIVRGHFFCSRHPCNPKSFYSSINMTAGQLCFLIKWQCASHRANWSNYSLCNTVSITLSEFVSESQRWLVRQPWWPWVMWYLVEDNTHLDSVSITWSGKSSSSYRTWGIFKSILGESKCPLVWHSGLQSRKV